MSKPDDDSSSIPTSPQSHFRRWGIRAFFLTLAVSLSLDTIPWAWNVTKPAKACLSTVLNRVGLWQGEWTLFAPNPDVDNGWISADITDIHSEKYTWNSPYWAEVGAFEKFYRFRHLNFYSRLQLRFNAIAVSDFARYIGLAVARDPSLRLPAIPIADPENPPSITSEPLSVAEVKVYHTSKQMMLPEADSNAVRSLPPRSETMWVLRTKLLGQQTNVGQ